MAGSGYAYPPPSDGKPFRLMMGLRTMSAENWIETGPELIGQLLEREQLISTKRAQVFGELPGYQDPATKFAELILENLNEFHAAEYLVSKDSVVTHLPSQRTVDVFQDHPFLQLAKVIGEDLCLISKVENQWLLTAAAVIYPSRWQLAEKLGKNVDQIHNPVPGYQEVLQPAMSLTFDKLSSDRQVWRLNWALHQEPILHQPTAESQTANPADYWWRTERQTLTKLVDGDHVLFTIRNRAEPLTQLLAQPANAHAFAQTLQTMTPETIAYKGLTKDHQALVDYLMSRQIS
jgi:hypothetical protein